MNRTRVGGRSNNDRANDGASQNSSGASTSITSPVAPHPVDPSDQATLAMVIH